MNKRPRCFDCFGYRYNHCVVLAVTNVHSINQEKTSILIKSNRTLRYIVVERRGDYG